MSDINNVILVGRLVEKPIIKYGQSGTAVTNLRVANNTYSKNSENQTKANFFIIVVFGKQAENCEKYLDKGRQIVVNGRLDQNSWEDNNGNKRSSVRVIANTIQFIGGGSGSGASSNSVQAPVNEPIPSEPAPETNESSTSNEESDFDTAFESPIDDSDNIPF